MLRLFTTLYPEKLPERRAEYEECLRRNLACTKIDEVCLWVEGEGVPIPDSPKIRVRRGMVRPSYSDFFGWINEVAKPEDFSIISNTDLWFDCGIRVLGRYDWRSPTVLALSRWDVTEDGSFRLYEHADSQDCWIVRGAVRSVRGGFPIGVYDCDNKIVWEFAQAGYAVVNPALCLRCYHLHLCGYRSYEVVPAPDHGIRPPFLYVEPDNLWGPLTAWRIKRKLDLPYLPWRMTAQRFWRYPAPRLLRRAWNKGIRILTGSLGFQSH